MQNVHNRVIFPLLLTLFASTFISCYHSQMLFKKKVADDKDALKVKSAIWNKKDPTLEPGDKVSITIWGHEDLSVGAVTDVYTTNEQSGRWILLNEEGAVTLPKIGTIKLAGMNNREANYLIEQKYSNFIKDPIVNIKVLNHRFTVMGEVYRPGTYSLNNEPINLVQCLGMAGGLTDFAEATQVEIIRKSPEGTEKRSFDLSDFNSLPQTNTITLQPDDIIYIPSHKNKAKQKNLEKAAPVISIIASITVLVSVLLK